MIYSKCPVCGSPELNDIYKVKDELVSKEYFQLQECSVCTLRITNPRPDDHELGKFYESEDYISHANKGNSLINKLYKIVRVFTLRGKRKLITKKAKEKSLLDIGCGTGHFIEHCLDHRWQVTGVEPDEGARTIGQENPQLKIVSGLGELANEQYDVITLWHVLEHLPDLTESIASINQKLKNEGRVYIAVPNYLSYEAQKFSEYWAAYDVPRHLYHFTPRAMEKLALNNGLIIERRYPMWFDSFYISLISNQHKFGRNKLLNSFLTGLLSNIYAINSKNYSSIIYQLKKGV